MKTLVTGANGFLGSAVVRRLLEGQEGTAEGAVRVFVRSDRGNQPAGVEVVHGDLGDATTFPAALDGVSRVIHAGARVSTSGAWKEFESVNVDATRELISAAQDAGIGQFVHVSSLSVYDVAEDGALIDEDSPLEADAKDRGFYAQSKLAADRAAQEAARQGAPVTIVRPGLIYGPGRPVPLARRSFAAGPFRLVLASPDYLMPMAYVDNVADALVLASQTEAARGRAYTIVDEHVRQADYASMFRQTSGQNWRPIFVPGTLLRGAASLVEVVSRASGRTSPVTRHQVDRTLRSARFDGSRVRAELQWHPRVTVFEGLRRAFGSQRSK